MSSDFYSTLCRRSGRENVDVFVPDLYVALQHVNIDGVMGWRVLLNCESI